MLFFYSIFQNKDIMKNQRMIKNTLEMSSKYFKLVEILLKKSRQDINISTFP